MTEPKDGGVAEPAAEHDPERAEQYAESVPVDPTPDEIDRYAELAGADGGTTELADPAEPEPGTSRD
jgi:hypothetical protein